MLDRRIVAVAIASTLAWMPLALPYSAVAQEEHQKMTLSPGQVVLEVTEEVNNLAAAIQSHLDHRNNLDTCHICAV